MAENPNTPVLEGVTVAEIGDGFGISVAGLLLGELGAAVVKLSAGADAAEGSYWVLNRDKTVLADDGDDRRREVAASADVVLVEDPSDLSGPITVRFADGGASSDRLLAPTETMLAEAASGIQSLQLGHRSGPYCLASPIAGYGAGVLGALSAVCGLLSRARGATGPWIAPVSYLDGALAFQSLSASFIRDPSPEPVRRRYADPYSVSFSPLLRFHRAADGWVFIGAISAHMWTTLFELIGRPEFADHPDLVGVLPFNIERQQVADEVAGAISAWIAPQRVQDVVDRLTQLKVVSAPVLSSLEFLEHPQAAANGLLRTRETPEGEQRQVGGFIEIEAGRETASPLPAPSGPLPLAGLRVIDVSRHAAGPICGRVLSDLGAEVVRIESPQGEAQRAIGMTFAATNRGKMSLGLDIGRGDGRAVLRSLVTSADFVLTNALPDAARRLGVDPETVARVNPSATVLTILGFGRRPPFGGRRVVDAAAQALSGQALAEGGGREPAGCTGGFLDNGAGWLAALGGVAALYRRQVAGVASSVETSLLSTSAFIQMHRMADPLPQSGVHLDEARTSYSWAQRLYRCRDGWVCVAANAAGPRAALARALGVEDPTSTAIDVAQATETAAGMTTRELGDLLARHEFEGWTTVCTLDGFARTRDDLFVEVPQAPWGTVLQPRRLPQLPVGTELELSGAPSRPGEHNVAVWEMFGLDVHTRAELVASGTMLEEPPAVTMLATSV